MNKNFYFISFLLNEAEESKESEKKSIEPMSDKINKQLDKDLEKTWISDEQKKAEKTFDKDELIHEPKIFTRGLPPPPERDI